MSHRLVLAAIAASILTFVGDLHAQVLTDAQVASIESVVAGTGGDLAALQSFDADLDLPTERRPSRTPFPRTAT